MPLCDQNVGVWYAVNTVESQRPHIILWHS